MQDRFKLVMTLLVFAVLVFLVIGSIMFSTPASSEVSRCDQYVEDMKRCVEVGERAADLAQRFKHERDSVIALLEGG